MGRLEPAMVEEEYDTRVVGCHRTRKGYKLLPDVEQ